MPVDIDEDTLQKIADLTGGKYYRADNAERFQQIYAEIDKLEKTEAVINKFAQFDELFPWFVVVRAGAAAGRSGAGTNRIPEAAMKILPIEIPPGFGVRQSSGAFQARNMFESGRGLPQSKTLSRQTDVARIFT